MSSKKTALITGASSGIGASYADRLARRGYNLLLVARRADKLEELAGVIYRSHGVNVRTLSADLGSLAGCEAVERVLLTDDNISLMINNAGIGQLGPSAEMEQDDLTALINVNVLALSRLSLAALQGFGQRGGGTIVNIASIAAFRAVKNGAAYGASKAFVLNFTRSLQLETEGTGVRFQCVLPGPVRTEFFAAAGVDPSLFPEESFITADQLVGAALAGLELGEAVTIPTLQNMSSYQTATDAFTQLREDAGRLGIVAPRYLA